MSGKTISTHVFFFPFTWRKATSKRSFYFKQHEQLREGEIEAIHSWRPKRHTIIEDKHYNELVYFYKPVQAMLYDQSRSCIVKTYEKQGMTYEDEMILTVDGKLYRLKIKEMSLKFYKSGIALLSFELLNTTYEQPEQIIAINGIGKCVYPYILPIEQAQKDYFPERIEIRLGKERIVEQFDKHYKKTPMFIADFIMALLGPSFSCNSNQVGREGFYIEPLFSNRMFTLCLYRNSKLLYDIKNNNLKDQFLTQFMVFSRKEKMTDVTYIDLPKVRYGIGRFALIGVTADDEESKVYNELATIAIVQRATLLHFSNQIAFITTLKKEQVVRGIGNLYEIYVQFINQMYFHEVTVDVQGSSIYEALLKQLKIKEEMTDLSFEMKEVHEYTSLIQKNQAQARMDILTIVGTLLVIPTFVTGFFGMNILEDRFMRWWAYKDVYLFLNSYVVLPVLAILGVYSWLARGHKFEKVWRVVLIVGTIISLAILMTQGCGLVK